MLPNVLQPSATDHVPVLAAEVRESLAVRPGETVIDATFGAGGHASLLAADLEGRGKLIAIDRDPAARTYFTRFEKRAGVQARLLSGDFGAVLEQLSENGVRADAILLDLGVSSMQLDRPERGFAAISASLGRTGRRSIARSSGSCPQMQTGNSGGHVQPRSRSRMKRLTIRSSSE